MAAEGDRIELVSTIDPYTNLSAGDRGTVTGIDIDPPEFSLSGRREKKVWVEWDSGSRLALLVGHDQFKIVDDE